MVVGSSVEDAKRSRPAFPWEPIRNSVGRRAPHIQYRYDYNSSPRTSGVADTVKPWHVLGACFLLSIGVNGYLIAPSSIMPLFVDRFDMTQTQAGFIVSAVILGMILAQVPAGYLMDRFDNRRLMLISAALFVLVMVVHQGSRVFLSFLGLRVIAGFVGGFVFTLGANIVGDVFPEDRLGLATGIYLASPPASFAIAHVSGPYLGPAYGPLRVFLLYAGITAAGMALFWLAVEQPIHSGDAPTVDEYLLAIRNPAVILAGLSSFSAYALYIFLNTWLPTYGTNVLLLPLAAAGAATALVPVAGIVARPSGGWLSGRIGGRRRPVLFVALSLGLVFMAVIPNAGSLLAFLFLIGAAAFTLQLGTGVYYVLARELAAAGTEGTSLTVITAISFSGSFSAPIVGGWLIETYSWPAAFAAFAGVAVLGIVALVPIDEPATS